MVKFPLTSLRCIAAATFVALLLCQQNFVVGKSEECDNPDAAPAEDPSCPSRPHIVNCAGEYLDTNRNKMLERSELEDAIESLPWYSKGILKILGSVDKIMAKCDADGDGAISMEKDMPATEETCLATCFKRKAFKSAFFSECNL